MFDLSQPEQFKRAVQASFDTTSPTYGTNDDFHWQFAVRLIHQRRSSRVSDWLILPQEPHRRHDLQHRRLKHEDA